MNNVIIKNKLLRIMLEDLDKAPDEFKPTNFWASNFNNLSMDIDQTPLEQFRSSKIANYFYVSLYSSLRLKKWLGYITKITPLLPQISLINKIKNELVNVLSGYGQAYTDYKIFKGGDNNHYPIFKGISESNYGQPIEHFCFNHSYFSCSFLNYLLGLVFLKKHIDCSQIRTVLEIGGGYGTLGEILLKSTNEIFYIDIDIPPVAYVATRYLEHVFSKSDVLNYELTRDNNIINICDYSQVHRAMVLCSWQLPKLKGDIDLFVNYSSFQEMEPNIVHNYVRLINRLSPKYILLRNNPEGKNVAQRIGETGVIEKTTKDHYIKYLNGHELIASDKEVFGKEHSEVMIFKRKS